MIPHKGLMQYFVLFTLAVMLAAPAGAQYVQQGGKLVGSLATVAALQGYSVAVSGDGNTVIVGGPADQSGTSAAFSHASRPHRVCEDGGGVCVPPPGPVGTAWVWTRSGTTWTQQAKLFGTGGVGTNMQQGASVGLSYDGNTAIVGGLGDNNFAGAAWVFTRSGTTWTQQGGKLVGTGAVDGSSGAQQGSWVALSGDGNTAIIGGQNDNYGAGAA